ncbi:MAG: hypothetical protein WC303_02070 [Candidatus Paceibacterota bacterium]|jgi:Tfp pilus assembly protein PilN
MAIELSSSEKESSSLIVNIFLTIAVLVLFAALGFFAYFHFMANPEKEMRISDLNREIAQQKSTTGGYSQEDLASIGEEVSDYKILFQSRAKTSKFFENFETWVHPQIYFSNFSLNLDSRSVSLSGAANGFQPVIQQIAILKNQPLIEKYEISNIRSNDANMVTFDFALIVSSQVLK